MARNVGVICQNATAMTEIGISIRDSLSGSHATSVHGSWWKTSSPCTMTW